MEKRAGQIAMEYVMIITLSLLITIPLLFLFRNYASESNEKIIEQRVAVMAKDLIDTGRQLYYYGPPSKSVVKVDMPQQVQAMGVISRQKALPSTDREYYIVFNILTSKGGVTLMYESDYPMHASDADPVRTGTTCGTLLGVPGCTNSPSDCFCLQDKDFTPGIKYFKVEASEGSAAACYNGMGTCVTVDEVSNELS